MIGKRQGKTERLEWRRTSKLVVPSPKGDLLSFPGTAVPGSGFFRPFRDWLAEKICEFRDTSFATSMIGNRQGKISNHVCSPTT